MRYHATPPAGEWLNDPNGLVHAGGAWRLFAQHRADAPTFRATGWARLSSDDLLSWRHDGAVIAAAADDWAYSGCVLATGDALTAIHTRHAAGLEDQVARVSNDAGATWSAARDALGPPARNRRDPFVFVWGDEWRMLLAAPCDWTNWRDEPASTLHIYAAASPGGPWRQVGAHDPGLPRGVMGEVPLLLADADGGWSLLLSVLDRRRDGSDGAVLRWRGAFDGARFVAATPARRLDEGPDYYAAMAATNAPMLVAWASSWATARAMPWPGFAGGPIALPREPTGRGMRPVPAIVAAFTRPCARAPIAGMARASVAGDFDLRIAGNAATLRITERDGRLRVTRDGPDLLRWSSDALDPAMAGTPDATPTTALTLFVDGPLVELHLAPSDRWVTAALPIADAFDVTLAGGGLAWTML